MGVSSATMMVSSIFPSSIVTSTWMLTSARTSIPVRSYFAKPGSEAVSTYSPGLRPSSR